MIYDDEEAEAKAAAARDVTAKSKATKKIVASRSTGFTPINRQITDVKKSTAANEEDNPEDEHARKPATRQSKRLLKKNDNESESAQPKKQKITIGRPTPGKHAITLTSLPATDT